MPKAPRNTATPEGMFEVASQGFQGSPEAGAAILQQEAAGQRGFVNSGTLPRQMPTQAKLALETAGVKFGDPVPGDDLFIYVELPEGWTRQSTSHSMHSDLLDEKGRKRAGIFYKAAFYDRRADLHIVTRFRMNLDYHAPDGTVTMRNMDFDTEVFSVSEPYSGAKYEKSYKKAFERATKQCEQWFEQNGFPDWENAGLYWD